MSRTVKVFMYVGCPVLWCSKLQAKIDLSITESEYIALSQAMCGVINFMEIMKQVSFLFDIHLPKPDFFVNNHQKDKITYVPIDPVADYVYIEYLILELCVGWKRYLTKFLN